jgi:hypothetical protein
MKGIKPLYLILLGVGAVLLIFGAIFITLERNIQIEPLQIQQDISRYTADQVILIVKAYAPYYEGTSWSTYYLGDGRWKIDAFTRFTDGATLQSSFYFIELTGQVQQVLNQYTGRPKTPAEELWDRIWGK